MSTQVFSALLPLVVVAATAVVLLLQIMIRRQHALATLLTVMGTATAFVAVIRSDSIGPDPITPLFVFDPLAAFFSGLILLATSCVAQMSYGYLKRASVHAEEFYLLLVLASLGAISMVMSAHFASFFLGIELLSISLYALLAYLPERPSGPEASIKYLVLAAGSSAFMLFGIALIYAQLGSLSFTRLAALLPSSGFEPVLTTGLAMLVVGLGFKLAVVPFHMWTPDVYQGAPAPVTAFVATASKGAVVAVMMRLFLQLGLVAHPWWATIFGILAAASMIAGNLLALQQNNLKRLLAYSSIAHLGYILVGLLAGGPQAAKATVFYLVAYTVTNLGAFGVISVLSSRGQELEELEHYRGLGQKRSWLAGIMTAMLLSLAGIPLTAGFFAKYLVLNASVGAMLWVLVFLLIANSALGLYYYLRVIVVMYMQPATMEATRPAAQARVSLLAGTTLAVLLGALLWLGVYPRVVLSWIETATKSIF